MVIIMLLSSLNSCMNPWIYMAFSNALQPLRTRCCCSKAASLHHREDLSSYAADSRMPTENDETQHYRMSLFSKTSRRPSPSHSSLALEGRTEQLNAPRPRIKNRLDSSSSTNSKHEQCINTNYHR